MEVLLWARGPGWDATFRREAAMAGKEDGPGTGTAGDAG
jgi:hypothetical protein